MYYTVCNNCMTSVSMHGYGVNFHYFTCSQNGNHKNPITKSLDKTGERVYNTITKAPRQKVGDMMTINSVASIRTGIVTGRKKAQVEGDAGIQYRMLNLKCIEPDGRLNLSHVESYNAKEKLNPVFLTQEGDVLVRLSFPYTSALICEQELCGLLVPSHFAIIRADNKKVVPEYLFWFLRRESTYQLLLQNSSGSSAFGTISSGFIGSLNIRILPLKQQKALGQLQLLVNREQDLLRRLAEEKGKYNKEALNIIYEKFKGEE